MGTTAIIIISILGVLLLTSLYVIVNLLKKNEASEDIVVGYFKYLDSISRVIELTSTKMKQSHLVEAFQSDDDIGFFFKQLNDIQEILNKFIIKKNG